MAKRVTNIIVLVEDLIQADLTRHYLQAAGHESRRIRVRDLPTRGSGEQYVRNRLPEDVRELRRLHTSKMLVVMTDADMWPVADRRQRLLAGVRPPPAQDEPIFVLIPKRHVETWIVYALGANVDEITDYTKAPHSIATAAQVKHAAERLLAGTRSRPYPPAPDSLQQAWPTLRSIAHA